MTDRARNAEVERLTRERDEARAEVERLQEQLQEDHEALESKNGLIIREINLRTQKVERERDEARAEVERLTREREAANRNYQAEIAARIEADEEEGYDGD